jgi:ABC-2 type transport system ATP-binding protein
MIRADNLHVCYGRLEALRGLNLSVPAGSAFALIGANGAGKTTTLRAAMNIIPPSIGCMTVLGVDARS